MKLISTDNMLNDIQQTNRTDRIEIMMNSSDVTNVWISGCAEWILEGRERGCTPYYVNVLFESLCGNEKTVIGQMTRAICNEFYRPFCYRFTRHPHRPREREFLPELMLFPDLPAYKRKKKASLREVRMNSGGFHYNGAMLIPAVSRFKGCPIQHIAEYQGLYTRGKIARVHVKPIDHRVQGISDYSAKTVKWGEQTSKTF